jgi:8-oxo-dGTP diphosphatase
MAEQYQPRSLSGVAVLITDADDRVLLLKRANSHGAGSWAPPGGHLDFGESFEQCAIRETHEEVGVEIGDLRFLAVTNDAFEAERKHYVTVWLSAKLVSGEPKIAAPRELSQVGWFARDALPEPLFLPFQHLVNGEKYPA